MALKVQGETGCQRGLHNDRACFGLTSAGVDESSAGKSRPEYGWVQRLGDRISGRTSIKFSWQ